MDPFLFVVGCERSGTTLLRAMLDSHPALAVPPESYFLLKVMRQPYDRAEFLSLLAEHRRFARWEMTVEDVASALDEAAVHDAAGAVRALYSAYAGARGKQRWGDKSPGYVHNIRGLSVFLPEARFVHIIRDGRDVALSWMDTPFGPESVAAAAERWRKDVSAGRGAGGEVRDRYIEVRYETLVTRPRKVLRKICDFIELEFDEAMLDYRQHADRIIAGTLEPEHHQRLRQEPTAGLRDWREQMAPGDVQAFEEIAGALLGRLGYATAA